MYIEQTHVHNSQQFAPFHEAERRAEQNEPTDEWCANGVNFSADIVSEMSFHLAKHDFLL